LCLILKGIEDYIADKEIDGNDKITQFVEKHEDEVLDDIDAKLVVLISDLNKRVRDELITVL
jgi:hypothetical protein